MSAVATSVGTFVWHEIVSPDPEQAEEFYTHLFGWSTEVLKTPEMDYMMIHSGGKNHGGFAKAMEGAPPPHWLGHIRVEDVESTIDRAKDAGGSVAAGPFDMPDVGRMAIIGDPQGAYVSIYAPQGDQPEASGVFTWDELTTTDVDRAQHFYEDVFDWTTTDTGPEYGGYRIFQRGENQIAGLMAVPGDSIPAHWQPYIYVDDVDRSAAEANELGGSTLLEPMDVPNVGRIAVLRDPLGAVFGIMKPLPPQ